MDFRHPVLTGSLTGDLEGVSIRVVEYAPDHQQAPHAHDFCSLTLVIAGSLDEWVDSNHQSGGPISVVAKPADVVHSNRVGPDGARTLQIVFPSSLLDPQVTGTRAPGWRWTHGGEPTRRMYALLRDVVDQPGDPVSIEGSVLDALVSAFVPAEERAGAAPRWLSRVADRVDRSFVRPPRVRELAHEAGVHPVVLARLFRRYFGSSITARLKRRRVEAAARLISRGLPLSGVAYECGFADQAHLTRVFGSVTGLSPGRFRRLAGAV